MWAKQKGFTIVELLIVIVVIGILAAIVIVAFNGVQNRAYDTAVKSDLANVSKQIMQYKAVNDSYPSTTAHMNEIRPKVTTSAYSEGISVTSNQYNFVYCPAYSSSPDPDLFIIVAQSKSGKSFKAMSGSVSEASYFADGSGNICNHASNAPYNNTAVGTSRIWLYNQGNWQSFVSK